MSGRTPPPGDEPPDDGLPDDRDDWPDDDEGWPANDDERFADRRPPDIWLAEIIAERLVAGEPPGRIEDQRQEELPWT